METFEYMVLSLQIGYKGKPRFWSLGGATPGWYASDSDRVGEPNELPRILNTYGAQGWEVTAALGGGPGRGLEQMVGLGIAPQIILKRRRA